MKRSAALILFIALIMAFTTVRGEGNIRGTYTIVDLKNPPEWITERKLTDEEVSGLSGASLDTLKEKISTYGDLIAWVRIDLLSRLEFSQNTTSDDNWQYTFGAEFSYFWMESWFSPNMTVSVAQYVLEDDYPGIGTVCVNVKDGGYNDMKCANCIPLDGGYYLVNAELFTDLDPSMLEWSTALDNMLFVSDLTGLLPYYEEKGSGQRVTQILLLDSADEVVMDLQEHHHVPQDSTHASVIFLDENAKYPNEGSSLDFASYGFPKQLSTESVIDAETARKLEKGTYEEAAAAISTIPDALNYLYYSGYSQFSGNQGVEMPYGVWNYNYKPNVVFYRGKGNCGGTSGLIAGLLEGDYDEVGMITLRYNSDNGHVINYIRDGELYYLFDVDSWVGNNYGEYGLSFSYGSSLEEIALKYAKANDTRNMVAYMNPRGGDTPIMISGKATGLPEHYCEYTVLQTTPEEGYVYIMMEEDPSVTEAIDVLRGKW